MKVKLIAIRSAGWGCIKGDTKTYIAEQVIDKGDHYRIIINSNPLSPADVRARKENYMLEITA